MVNLLARWHGPCSGKRVVIVALVAEGTNKRSRLLLACAVGGVAALAVAAELSRASPSNALPTLSQENPVCEEEAAQTPMTPPDCAATDHRQASSVLFRQKVTWEAN